MTGAGKTATSSVMFIRNRLLGVWRQDAPRQEYRKPRLNPVSLLSQSSRGLELRHCASDHETTDKEFDTSHGRGAPGVSIFVRSPIHQPGTPVQKREPTFQILDARRGVRWDPFRPNVVRCVKSHCRQYVHDGPCAA